MIEQIVILEVVESGQEISVWGLTKSPLIFCLGLLKKLRDK